MHACKNCKYYYETLCEESMAPIYNALMDAVMPVIIDHIRPCCGHKPGGIILDQNAPRCRDYEAKI